MICAKKRRASGTQALNVNFQVKDKRRKKLGPEEREKLKKVECIEQTLGIKGSERRDSKTRGIGT